jgi:hypothetical protein
MELIMTKQNAKYMGAKDRNTFSDKKIKMMRKNLKSLKEAKYVSSKKNHTVTDTKVFFGYYRLATNCINKVADEAQNYRNDLGSMYGIKAGKLSDTYHKTGFLRVRRALTSGEIKKYFLKKDKMIAFLDEVKNVKNAANKAIKVFNKAETAWNTFEALYNINNHYQITRSNESMKTNAKALRDDFDNAYQAMNEVMKLVNTISNVAPPGVKEYLGFITESFKAAGKGIQTVKGHAERIEKLSTSSSKSLTNTVKESGNWWNSVRENSIEDLTNPKYIGDRHRQRIKK